MSSDGAGTRTPRIERTEGFAPIGAYGLLGDGRAVALVALDGHIDWFAAPRLDAQPLCAAVLDPSGGGSIVLEPEGAYEASRRYLPGTAVLETTFHTATGTVRVTDSLNQDHGRPLPWTELARRVDAEGEVAMRWSVQPGNRFATARPWATLSERGPCIEVGDAQLLIVTEGIGEPEEQLGRFDGRFVAVPGRRGLLAVLVTAGEPSFWARPEQILSRIESSATATRRFCEAIDYDGAHREAVERSAIVLKSLSVGPSGAIAASATTSLPERVGSSRNFDYRFAWVRDGCFSIDALTRLGVGEDVHRSLSWLLGAVEATAPEIHPFYNLEGAPAATSVRKPPTMPGYRSSPPVQSGNPAAGQRQLGGFGDLVDAVWRYVDHGGQLDRQASDLVAKLADTACDRWILPDAGIWELGEERHYTSSKINCWACCTRAADLADRGQVDATGAPRWRAEAEAIRHYVEEQCWSERRQAYVQYAGGDALDAAVLLAARIGFLEGDDPRLSSTIDAVVGELGEGPLLYRYSGMREKENAFVACCFWAVEALAHAGRVDEAAERLEGVLSYANDLGLFSEEVDPKSGALLGNMPLALSHLAVIGGTTAVHRARARQPVS